MHDNNKYTRSRPGSASVRHERSPITSLLLFLKRVGLSYSFIYYIYIYWSTLLPERCVRWHWRKTRYSLTFLSCMYFYTMLYLNWVYGQTLNVQKWNETLVCTLCIDWRRYRTQIRVWFIPRSTNTHTVAFIHAINYIDMLCHVTTCLYKGHRGDTGFQIHSISRAVLQDIGGASGSFRHWTHDTLTPASRLSGWSCMRQQQSLERLSSSALMSRSFN